MRFKHVEKFNGDVVTAYINNDTPNKKKVLKQHISIYKFRIGKKKVRNEKQYFPITK